jgi:hypothetical protein
MKRKTENQKRSAVRIPASLVVKFMHRGSVCYGLITDISQNGMRINSGVCLPANSSLKLMLPLKEEVLELPVKVRRLVETDAFYDIMGVEVLKPPEKYIQIVENFKCAYEA